MSIHLLRQKLMDVLGSHELTMAYEDGGRVQVFSLVGRVVKLPGSAGLHEIETQLRHAFAANA